MRTDTGLLLIILIIAAVVISNTMLMAVYKRVRELDIMRALFLWVSGGIGLLGNVLGIAIAVLAAPFSTHRILRLDIPSSLRD